MDQAMVSEERQNEGSFLTGGNTREFVELQEEQDLNEFRILNPAPVRDGPELLAYLRTHLHKFDSPYAYIGGEANSPARDNFNDAEVKVLIARLSTYESTSLSMSHSLMAQIYSEEPGTFCDTAFLPKPNDYQLLVDNGFPVWFGTNSKLAPNRFDLLSITHAVSMEQLNFIPMLHDSGIPIFKQQRMEREDIPIIIMGGANSGTPAPLCGSWTDSQGKTWSCLIDAVIYGDGEEAGKEVLRCIKEGKAAGLTKREILRSMHGRVQGFYEPDLYEHVYDGHSRITSINPLTDYAEFPVKRATVVDLDTVRTLETKILPYSGDGTSVDVAIAGSVGCIGSAGHGACSFCREGSEGPYRERSLPKVMEALDAATRNQGTKEVSFFCFAPDVMLLTEEGLKRFDGASSADRLMDYEGMSNIAGLEQRAEQRTLNVKTKHGLDLPVTPEHRVQVWADAYPFHQFKRADELRPGDRLIGKLGGYEHVKGTERGRALTERDAELMGLLTGDGYRAAGKARLYVAAHETELVSWVEKNTQGYWNERDDGTRLRVFGYQHVGELTKTQIAAIVREAPATQAAAYLRGLFEADGSVNTKAGALYCSFKQKERARQTMLMLRALGIAAKLAIVKGKNPWTGAERTYHEVHVVGGRARGLFAQLIGFLSESKNQKLAEWCKKQDRSEPFAMPKIVREVLRNMKEAYKGVYGDIPDTWRKRAPAFTLNNDTVAAATVREIVQPSEAQTQDSERILAFLQQDLTLETVTAIEEGPTTVTYDAIDSRHGMIWANGVIASQSLNFNQYAAFFPLVDQSVRRGYKVGLISQRVDMLAETPEQIRVQRWLKKSNFTLGVEGISSRTRAYLNKNLQEWEILLCATEMMKNGAGELKWFLISTGLEQDVDIEEWCSLMEKVNAIRSKLGASTRFRISVTPLFPSAYTALQFAPAMAALNHGQRSLDKMFNRAKELGWGRRLSVSGEEPLVSNTINHGGRNIFGLLLSSHFQDGWRFYGNVPKGTWKRWQTRIDADPNVDLDVIWGEKSFNYIFPWEDISYSTSKEILYRAYMKHVAFQGLSYCLTTRTVKGVCKVNECGACDPRKEGKPRPELIKNIVGRRVKDTISTEAIMMAARSREKSYHLRVLFETRDPIYRYVAKGYFMNAIPRALMKVSDEFNDAFVGPLGHARIAAGANLARDWTFGRNIYDFSLCEYMKESDLRKIIEPANALIGEGRILDIRMDDHLTVLRNDVDYAVYTALIPNGEVSYARIRSDVERYFERLAMGKESSIKIKKTQGKGVFVTVHRTLDGKDVRQVDYEFLPDHRGTLLRFVISANYNPMSMLEAITGRKAFTWKAVPIFCDGYVQLDKDTGEFDVFAALAGTAQKCSVTGGPLEMDLFTGQKMATGISLAADGGLDANYPIDLTSFYTKELQPIVVGELQAA